MFQIHMHKNHTDFYWPQKLHEGEAKAVRARLASRNLQDPEVSPCRTDHSK